MLQGIRNIHFIGVGGAGMSALARILLDEGYAVSGSDKKMSATAEQLAARGAKIFEGHDAANVNGADAVVVSTAIPENNVEVAAAKSQGIQILHRSDVNAALLNAAKGIAVAGAHGKTTTTSMIGLILEHGGVDPTIIIGGQVDYLADGNARLGRGEYLVSEADESDGSFLKLMPHIAVVTNVENDHMDHYGTMENIKKAFRQFLEEKTGTCVLCAENENLREISKNLPRRVVFYGTSEDAEYRATNIAPEGTGVAFDVEKGGQKIVRVRLNIPGHHNVLNALGSVVTGILCGVSPEKAAEALALFHGAKRRFETKGRAAGVWIVDDYAHHPTEIMATLKAARQTSSKRLICAFQPHRYSRTRLLQKEFGGAFKDADLLILTDVYSAGEAPIAGVSGETIVNAVAETTGQPTTYVKARVEIAPYLKTIVRDGDLVLTMGAGDIYRTGEELLALLAAQGDKDE